MVEEVFASSLPSTGTPPLLVILKEQLMFLENSETPLPSSGDGVSPVTRIIESGYSSSCLFLLSELLIVVPLIIREAVAKCRFQFDV